MTETPLYEAVKATLDVDPEVIAERPAWSFRDANARLAEAVAR